MKKYAFFKYFIKNKVFAGGARPHGSLSPSLLPSHPPTHTPSLPPTHNNNQFKSSISHHPPFMLPLYHHYIHPKTNEELLRNPDSKLNP